MLRRLIPIAIAITVLAWTLPGLAQSGAKPAASSAPRDQASPPLSAQEIRALASRVISNQHRDDEASEAFEHTDQLFDRPGDAASAATETKMFRVVPTGSGTLKLLLKENGKPVSPLEYRRQLKIWTQVLEVAVQPDDPRQKASLEKWRKKRKERADLVDSALEAFHFGWLGREMRNGRHVTKLSLEPNPRFQPRTRAADILTHARAVIWIDDRSGQMMHAEADIIRDISFGGGILGKVYHGGHFEMDQAEAAPGVWLPTRYKYDFSGRKFLFGFELHELTEISRYRRLGTPRDALEVARRELQTNPSNAAGDP
ncbi:MAG: hypothetical protein ACRD4K_16625 [Candidatus Acidiferrales bacterium]